MDLMDYRRKIIANSPHLMSASGAVVSFSDGADLPLKSLIVDIDPVQSGTGDPSPTNVRPISGWDAVNVKNGNTVIATISLGQTVYGGTLNPLTGVLTVDAELEVFNNVGTNIISSNINYLNLNSSVNTVGDYTRITFGVLSAVDQSVYNRASNTYKYKMCNLAPHKFSYNDASVHWYRNTALYLFLPTSLCGSTAQSVLNYLVGIKDTTPLSLWIPLAQPFNIQLTPQQIRSLYGNNTIFADTGNVALEYWAHP